jgi:hypothetical protein
MMAKIQEEGKKVHLFVMKGLMSGYTKTDIARILYDKKCYSSLESAKNTVTKITKEIGSIYENLCA